MNVEDIFLVGGKTVFAGDLETPSKNIMVTPCKVFVDGTDIAQILIEGEVLGVGGHRDLWTKSKVQLDRETVRMHKVQLISV